RCKRHVQQGNSRPAGYFRGHRSQEYLLYPGQAPAQRPHSVSNLLLAKYRGATRIGLAPYGNFESKCIQRQGKSIPGETSKELVGKISIKSKKIKTKYEIILYWSEADDSFLAEIPELPGCMADGKT